MTPRRHPGAARERLPAAGEVAPPRHEPGRRRGRRAVQDPRAGVPGALRPRGPGPLRRRPDARRGRPAGRRSRPGRSSAAPAFQLTREAARWMVVSGVVLIVLGLASAAWVVSLQRADADLRARGVPATVVVVAAPGGRVLEFTTRDGQAVRTREDGKTGEVPAVGRQPGGHPLRPPRSHPGGHRPVPHRPRRHPLDRGGEVRGGRGAAHRVRPPPPPSGRPRPSAPPFWRPPSVASPNFRRRQNRNGSHEYTDLCILLG